MVDRRKGDERGRVESALAWYPVLSTCQPSKAATTPALCLSLSRGAALLDNKLYSTSTGTVLRTTGSPTVRRRPPVGYR